MDKGQAHSMQHLALWDLDLQRLKRSRWMAIGWVTYNRVIDVGHMDADLMRAPRGQGTFHHAGYDFALPMQGLYDFIVRQCLFARGLQHCHPLAIFGVAPDAGVDLA